jgi:hypothetical protein
VIRDLPKLNPEPDYIIRTRPPMWDDWRLNISRGIKENRLKMDANKIARRKCWKVGTALEECCQEYGMFKTFNCKNQLTAMLECCHHE